MTALCRQRLCGLAHLAQALLFGARRAKEISEPATLLALCACDAIPKADDRVSVIAGGDESKHARLIGKELTFLAVLLLAVSVSSNPFGSDHVPFIDAGLPAVLTIEADDGANNDDHSARDTLDKLDITLALQILKMNLATLAGYLGRP